MLHKLSYPKSKAAKNKIFRSIVTSLHSWLAWMLPSLVKRSPLRSVATQNIWSANVNFNFECIKKEINWNLSIYPFNVYLPFSVNLSYCLFSFLVCWYYLYLSIHLIYLTIYLSTYINRYNYLSLFVYLPIYIYTFLTIYLCISIYLYVSIYLH